MRETPHARISTDLTVESLFPERIETESTIHKRLDTNCTVFELYNLIKDTQDIRDSLEHIYGWSQQQTLKDTQEKIQDWRKRWIDGTTATYLIEENTENEFVGIAWLIPKWDYDKVQFAVWIHPKHQRNGYATERAYAHIETAFEILDCEVVEIHVSTKNTASMKDVEKYLEYYKTDTSADGVIKNDSYNQQETLYNSKVYTLTHQEYEQTHN